MSGSARDSAIRVARAVIDQECSCEMVAATAIVDALAARPDVLRALADTEADDGYCCPAMRSQSSLDCDTHTTPGDCPDVLVVHSDRHGPGLPVRDGGGSFVAICFCPWCGSDLTRETTAGLDRGEGRG